MVLFNYTTKEITSKIVYYGAGLCGKTTNLQYIYKKLSPNVKGKLLSLATETDRTLFFDFLPVDFGEISGHKIRFQLYTVPGQVYYNATRKLVLKGVDGIVFVADSQIALLEKNKESLGNLRSNLIESGLDLDDIPLVFQFNKRDLPNINSVEEIKKELNCGDMGCFESIATTGEGVFETLREISKKLIEDFTKRYKFSEKTIIKGIGEEKEEITLPEKQEEIVLEEGESILPEGDIIKEGDILQEEDIFQEGDDFQIKKVADSDTFDFSEELIAADEKTQIIDSSEQGESEMLDKLWNEIVSLKEERKRTDESLQRITKMFLDYQEKSKKGEK